jgi:hypothetical protein
MQESPDLEPEFSQCLVIRQRKPLHADDCIVSR